MPSAPLRAALALTFAMPIASCSFLSRNVPNTHTYQLAPGTVAVLVPPEVRIELRTSAGTGPFEDEAIAYQVSPYRLDTYQFNRWVAAPSDLLRDRLREILYQPSEVGPAQPNAEPWQLDARVQAFQEVDYDGRHSGVVAVQFCLYPSTPFSRAVWCKTESKENPASSRGIAGAVAAISLSFNQVMEQFANDLSAEATRLASTADAKPHAPAQP